MTERDLDFPTKFITPLDEELTRCPPSSWERDWVEDEQAYLGRKPEPLKRCTDCMIDKVKIQCFAIPKADKVRLVTFPEFGIKTFSLDNIEECGLRNKS